MGEADTTEIGSGTAVFTAAAVRGTWRRFDTPDAVLDVMDDMPDDVIACVADAGATFLAPIFDDLRAVVCLSGTPLSHIGIVSREYQVPCIMATVLTGEPVDGDTVEIDCSDVRGVVRKVGVNGAGVPLGEGWDKARVNETLLYHSRISHHLTSQRTALESALIPITAYILVGCVESYRRYPDLMRAIDAAMPAEEIGRAGHEFGNRVDTVRLWSIANFPLVGRNIFTTTGMVDWAADEAGLAVVFDFWERAARGYYGDHRLAADNGGLVTPFTAKLDAIADGLRPIGDDGERATITRLNALLTSYEFLLWFDTRSGYQDSGPYRLADGRSLLLREFLILGESDFEWSHSLAQSAPMPYDSVLAAFVVDDVSISVSDFGTAVTEPEEYLSHVREFALFDTSGGGLVPITADQYAPLAAAAKAAQRAQYRSIAGMDKRAKIDTGAYVYFSFLRAFADVAGVADDLDWTCPRDSLDVYPFLELIDVTPDMSDQEPDSYYPQIP